MLDRHIFVCSVPGKKKTPEGHVLPGNILGKEKGSAAEGAGSLLLASPPHQENSSDLDSDSKPKKGIIFEICSEEGFHIRCESIEGGRSFLLSCIYLPPLLFFFFFFLKTAIGRNFKCRSLSPVARSYARRPVGIAMRRSCR